MSKWLWEAIVRVKQQSLEAQKEYSKLMRSIQKDK